MTCTTPQKDHHLDILGVESKPGIRRMRAFQEQRYGADLGRVLELRVGRYRQRTETVYLLVATLERFLGSHEQPYVWSPRA